MQLMHTEGVIELNEPQMWTVIGVLAAALLGTITLITQMTMRVMNTHFTSFRSEVAAEFRAVRSEFKAELGAVHSELKAELGAVHSELKAELGAVKTELGAVHNELNTEIRSLRNETSTQFESVHTQIAHLDREVQEIRKHVFSE